MGVQSVDGESKMRKGKRESMFIWISFILRTGKASEIIIHRHLNSVFRQTK